MLPVLCRSRHAMTLLCLLPLLCAGVAAAPLQRTHVVYILADDLGWKDVGFHGGTVSTPNLDKLAKAGAMLNAFYVQPGSTQTRAAALTGRYPMRYGFQTGTITAASTWCLPPEERTLAQALKESGYATAFIGKWQLGHARPECLPTRRGFNHFYGPMTQPLEPVLRKGTRSDWRHDEKPVKVEGDVSEIIGKAAADYVLKADAGRPFFLVVSFTAPAAPFGAGKTYLARHAGVQDETQRRYLAAISALDDAVGNIVDALQKKGLADNTLIIMHSDSGAARPIKYSADDGEVPLPVGDNAMFREGRGSLYDGGLRVPALVWWPARVPAGNVLQDPVHVTDITATLMALSGASADARRKPDGLDLWPALEGKARSPRKEILLHVDEFGGALRAGEYKVVVHAALPTKVEVFHIANDPEETENLAERDSAKTQDMLKRLNEFAYDMLPALQLEEWLSTHAPRGPALWRPNPARR